MIIHSRDKRKDRKIPKNYKGYCFFDTQIPNVKGPHLIVIITEPIEMEQEKVGKSKQTKLQKQANQTNKEKIFKSLAVMICSIKDSDSFNYDDSCILFPDDICDKKHKDILSIASYIRYDSCFELEDSEIYDKKKAGILQYRCKISPEFLENIKCGLVSTNELSKDYYKYITDIFLKGLNIEEHKKQNLQRKENLQEMQKQDLVHKIKVAKSNKTVKNSSSKNKKFERNKTENKRYVTGKKEHKQKYFNMQKRQNPR